MSLINIGFNTTVDSFNNFTCLKDTAAGAGISEITLPDGTLYVIIVGTVQVNLVDGTGSTANSFPIAANTPSSLPLGGTGGLNFSSSNKLSLYYSGAGTVNILACK